MEEQGKVKVKGRQRKNRHLEVLGFIKTYIAEYQYPPSVREIGEGIGLNSASCVHRYLEVLEEEKFIKRVPGAPRAMVLLDKAGVPE